MNFAGKITAALALTGALAVATATPSQARWWGWGWGGPVAAGIGHEFRRAYTVIGAAGRQAPLLATAVLLEVAAVPDARPDRLVFGRSTRA